MYYHRRQRYDKGLSLVEVLVAVFILTIVALPLLNVFTANTMLLRSSYTRTDTTYDSIKLMENLQPLGYSGLFSRGSSSIIKDTNPQTNTGKFYTLQLKPSGPNGVVSGTACFMHLVVKSDGTGVFAGAADNMTTSSLIAINSTILNNLTLVADTASDTYSLKNGSNTIISGKKDKNSTPVLIININKNATTAKINVSITNSAAGVIAYAPAAFTEANLAVNVSNFKLLNNDDPPTAMLVHAIIKTYPSSSSDINVPESVYQDTFTEGTLP
jgi:prepilin-type N-terminal cleavage/methylation domain-containing protein